LQKVLAHAGFGSRRACEDLITQGRVTVNGQVMRVLGTKIDPTGARIAVDGETIKMETPVYYAVNKPKGYVSTNHDPSGRPRVIDLLPEIPQRVYTVGRLDEDSTGLLILTNDGELANKLAHPRYGVEKLYRALVAGSPTREMLSKLTDGVWLSDGKVKAKRVRIAGKQGQATMLELVLAEGKKREIRRMLSKLGHKVMTLNRIAVGPISLKGLPVGECRPLSRGEVDLLKKVASGVSVSVPRFFDEGSKPNRDLKRPGRDAEGRTARDGDDAGTPRGRAPQPGGRGSNGGGPRDRGNPRQGQGQNPRQGQAPAPGQNRERQNPRQGQAPAPGQNRERPPRPPAVGQEPRDRPRPAGPVAGRPKPPRPDSAERKPSPAPPSRNVTRKTSAPAVRNEPSPPLKLHVEPGSSNPPGRGLPTPRVAGRRIIGMDTPAEIRADETEGISIAGRRKPKRPATKKQPPAALGIVKRSKRMRPAPGDEPEVGDE
jgi:23S rRNA pseudouridine2605 synthase